MTVEVACLLGLGVTDGPTRTRLHRNLLLTSTEDDEVIDTLRLINVA